MLTYILVTITVLILVICGTVFYGYRQMNQLTLNVQKNIADIGALRHLLQDGYRDVPHPPQHNRGLDNNQAFPFPDEDDVIEETYVDSDDEEHTKHDNNDEMEDEMDNEQEFKENEMDELEHVLDEIEQETEKQVNGNEAVVEDIPDVDTDMDSAEDNEITETEENDKIVEVAPVKQKSGKKTPNEPAKDCSVGYTLLSSNDNNMYEVTETKSGVKRWKRIVA